MRNKLFLILFIALICIIANAKTEDFGYQSITLTLKNNNGSNKEIPEEKQANPEKPSIRGIISQPVYAYLYINTLSVGFENRFSTVCIHIINQTSGEIIYNNTYSFPDIIQINLNNESHEDYIIEIEADELLYQGSFNL